MNAEREHLVRDAALATLHDYCCPLTREELSLVLRATGPHDVSVAELDELLDCEERAFDAGQDRPVWVCPAVEPPDCYPDTDFLSRSDWPPENRVVRHDVEPERRLWLLRRVADHVVGLIGERKDPVALVGLLADLVRTLPTRELEERLGGMTLDLGDKEAVLVVRELAEDRHREIAAGVSRRDLAALVDELDPRDRLFGRQDD